MDDLTTRPKADTGLASFVFRQTPIGEFFSRLRGAGVFLKANGNFLTPGGGSKPFGLGARHAQVRPGALADAPERRRRITAKIHRQIPGDLPPVPALSFGRGSACTGSGSCLDLRTGPSLHGTA